MEKRGEVGWRQFFIFIFYIAKVVGICSVFGFHLVGVIWIGRWAGERKERMTEVTS